MKGTIKYPKSYKEWLSLFLIIFTIILGGWPIIPLLNNTTIVFGMPILMIWSVFIIFFTTFVLWFINKIGGTK